MRRPPLVVLAGGAPQGGDARLLAGLARRISRGIAAEGWRLAVAARGDVGAAALAAAEESLATQGKNVRQALSTIFWEGEPVPGDIGGRLRRLGGATRAEYGARLVMKADALLLVGGGDESLPLAEAALARRTLVVPVPLGEGTGHAEFRRIADAQVLSVESRSELEMLDSRPYTEAQAARSVLDLLRRELRGAPRLALWLGGGLERGAAQAGALVAVAELLRERETAPQISAGSGIGAWNLMLWLAEGSGGLQRFWHEARLPTHLGRKRMWSGHGALLDPAPLRRQYLRWIAPHIDRLASAGWRWAVARTELGGGGLRLMCGGEGADTGRFPSGVAELVGADTLADALVASLAVAGVFPAVMVRGERCGDGSLAPGVLQLVSDAYSCRRLLFLSASALEPATGAREGARPSLTDALRAAELARLRLENAERQAIGVDIARLAPPAASGAALLRAGAGAAEFEAGRDSAQAFLRKLPW